MREPDLSRYTLSELPQALKTIAASNPSCWPREFTKRPRFQYGDTGARQSMLLAITIHPKGWKHTIGINLTIAGWILLASKQVSSEEWVLLSLSILEVSHKCGIASCIAPFYLVLETTKDNNSRIFCLGDKKTLSDSGHLHCTTHSLTIMPPCIFRSTSITGVLGIPDILNLSLAL